MAIKVRDINKNGKKDGFEIGRAKGMAKGMGTTVEGFKKGGSAKKKKQGFKDRKDESIAMRVKKKRSAKQLKASANESYGKFGSKAKKSGKINK